MHSYYWVNSYVRTLDVIKSCEYHVTFLTIICLLLCRWNVHKRIVFSRKTHIHISQHIFSCRKFSVYVRTFLLIAFPFHRFSFNMVILLEIRFACFSPPVYRVSVNALTDFFSIFFLLTFFWFNTVVLLVIDWQRAPLQLIPPLPITSRLQLSFLVSFFL